jgi:hypothetical protein
VHTHTHTHKSPHKSMLMRLDNVLQGHPSVCQPLNILEDFWIVVLIALQIILLATSILCQILTDVGNISAVKQCLFVSQRRNSYMTDIWSLSLKNFIIYKSHLGSWLAYSYSRYHMFEMLFSMFRSTLSFKFQTARIKTLRTMLCDSNQCFQPMSAVRRN